MQFYTSDLVDYARRSYPRGSVESDELFAMPGEPCPRSGLWSPRADVPLPDGFVKQGERMPMAGWRDNQGQSQRRAIKWQWVKPLT